MTDWIGGVSSGLGTVAAAGIQAAVANKQMRETRALHDKERAEALADRAHLESYNDPAMQRYRLEQAGFSPQEYVDAGASSTPDKVDYTAGMDSAYSNLAGAGAFAAQIAPAMIGAMLTQSQIGVNNTEAKVNEARADNLTQNTEGQKLQNMITNETKASQIAIMKANSDLASQSLKKGVEELKLLRQQGKLNERQDKLLGLQIDLDEKVLNSRVALARLQVTSQELDNKIKDFTLNESLPIDLRLKDSQIRRNSADIALIGAQIGYVVQNTENLVKEGVGIDLRNESLGIQNSFDSKKLEAFKKTFDGYVQNIQDKYKIDSVTANWSCANQWINAITKGIDTASKAIGVVYGAGKLGSALGTSAPNPLSSFNGYSSPTGGFNPYAVP